MPLANLAPIADERPLFNFKPASGLDPDFSLPPALTLFSLAFGETPSFKFLDDSRLSGSYLFFAGLTLR